MGDTEVDVIESLFITPLCVTDGVLEIRNSGLESIDDDLPCLFHALGCSGSVVCIGVVNRPSFCSFGVGIGKIRVDFHQLHVTECVNHQAACAVIFQHRLAGAAGFFNRLLRDVLHDLYGVCYLDASGNIVCIITGNVRIETIIRESRSN